MADPAVALERGADVWDRAHSVLTLGLIFTVSMTAFEAMAVATVLPATVADIGGLAYYGWAFSGFMLAEIVGISVAGPPVTAAAWRPPIPAAAPLHHRPARRRLGPSMPILIASRVLQGLGAGAISDTLLCGDRARLRRGGAPAHARAHLERMGDSRPDRSGTGRQRRRVRRLAVGFSRPGSAQHRRRDARRSGDAPPRTSAAASASEATTGAALALAVGAAAVLIAPTLPSPIIGVPLALAGAVVAVPSLRRLLPTAARDHGGALTTAVVVMALLSAAFFGAEAFVPLSLTDVRGRSVTLAGITLTAATLSWTAGAWIQARVASRYRRRTLIMPG